MSFDLDAIKAHIEELIKERDEASAEAEGLHAGMREVALFRAANAQGCLGNYAVPLLAEVERLREQVRFIERTRHANRVMSAEITRLRGPLA